MPASMRATTPAEQRKPASATAHGTHTGRAGNAEARPGEELRSSGPAAAILLRGTNPLPKPRGRQAGNGSWHYQHVLIIADFVDTTDAFHRRLVALAQRLAPRFGLVQCNVGTGDTQTDPCVEILLEGLRHRMGLTARNCAIIAARMRDRPLSGVIERSGRRLVILGRSTLEQQHPEKLTGIVDDVRALGCDLITIDETTDFD